MKGNIFIKRPVMAISISILILVVGLISLFSLPVEQYPNIAPPTVNVSATYTGADANAVMNSVIMPLEESINGVENMMYITSTATNAGTATIEVFFKQGTDPSFCDRMTISLNSLTSFRRPRYFIVYWNTFCEFSPNWPVGASRFCSPSTAVTSDGTNPY